MEIKIPETFRVPGTDVIIEAGESILYQSPSDKADQEKQKKIQQHDKEDEAEKTG